MTVTVPEAPTLVGRRVLARNIFSNGAALAVEVVSAFLLTPIIIAYLGIGLYGVWSLLNGIIGYLGIADLGVRGSTGRFINLHFARNEFDKAQEVYSTSLSILLILTLLIIAITVVIGTNIGALFPKIDESLHGDIGLLLPLLAVILGLQFQCAVYRQVLHAHDRFDLSNAIQIVTTLIRFGLAIPALIYGFGLFGLIIANLVSSLFSYVAYVLVVHTVDADMRFNASAINYRRIGELWKFGSAVFLVRSNSQLTAQSDQVILMYFLGAEATGIYSIATIFVTYGDQVRQKIGGTLLPSVQKLGAVKDFSALAEAFFLYARLTSVIGILLYIGFLVFGQSFLNLWIEGSSIETSRVLGILSISALLGLHASNLQSVMFSLGQLRINLVISSLYALVNILASVALVGFTDLGVLGAALGTLSASIMLNVIVGPLVAIEAVRTSLKCYLVNMSIPITIVTLLAYTVFHWLAGYASIDSWFLLASSAIVAAAIYLMFSVPIFFGVAKTVEIFGLIIKAVLRR